MVDAISLRSRVPARQKVMVRLQISLVPVSDVTLVTCALNSAPSHYDDLEAGLAVSSWIVAAMHSRVLKRFIV